MDVADDFVEEVAPVSLPPTAELPEIKLFGRWSCDDVQVSDMSLQVSMHTVYICGMHMPAGKVEHVLINRLMLSLYDKEMKI